MTFAPDAKGPATRSQTQFLFIIAVVLLAVGTIYLVASVFRQHAPFAALGVAMIGQGSVFLAVVVQRRKVRDSDHAP